MGKWTKSACVPIALAVLATCSVRGVIFTGVPDADVPLIEDTGVTADAEVMIDAAMMMDAAIVPDTVPDAAVDAASANCFAHWFNDTFVFSQPVLLISLSTSGDERDPWLSSDGLRLYYARDPSGSEESDIFQAERTAPGQPFLNASVVPNVNTGASHDGSPGLTPDETMLALSSNRDGSGFSILIATRAAATDSFTSPTTAHLSGVNAGNGHRFDPFLADGGKRLYLAPVIGGRQYLAIASRDSIDASFGQLIELAGISNGQHNDADPAVAADERILVFSSARTGSGGGVNLWYATRGDTRSNFGPPRPIHFVNSDAEDVDPMISDDGCELLFASTRQQGDSAYRLYSATIMR